MRQKYGGVGIVQFVNHYSFLLVAVTIGILLFLGLLGWSGGDRFLRIALFAGYLIIVMATYSYFRYPSNDAESLPQVQTELRDGRPTLVVLYSKFCIGCMMALPAVRDLETELKDDQIDTLLVDVHSDGGDDVAKFFKFEVSPTYIICDTSGQEIWRSSGTPTRAEVNEILARQN